MLFIRLWIGDGVRLMILMEGGMVRFGNWVGR